MGAIYQKKMGCNMFFNAKSVALAGGANLTIFWSIGFELRSHLESLAGTMHHKQTLSRAHTTN